GAVVTIVVVALYLRPEIPAAIAGLTKDTQQFQRLTGLQLRSRTDLNDLSWKLALEHPAFGVGPGNYTKYSLAAGLVEDSGEGSYHHNAVLGTAAEFGFIGLGCFLLWFATFLSSRAPGRLVSPIVLTFATLTMAQGLSHGLFLNVFDALP